MKIPRWLVGTMAVSSAALSSGALGVWLAWPTITARQFVSASRACDFESANSLLSNGEWYASNSSIQLRLRDPGAGLPTCVGSGVRDPQKARIEIVTEPLGLGDFFRGCRRMRLSRLENYPHWDDVELRFEARYGTVRCQLWSREP